jgi:hypothetical protein
MAAPRCNRSKRTLRTSASTSSLSPDRLRATFAARAPTASKMRFRRFEAHLVPRRAALAADDADLIGAESSHHSCIVRRGHPVYLHNHLPPAGSIAISRRVAVGMAPGVGASVLTDRREWRSETLRWNDRASS